MFRIYKVNSGYLVLASKVICNSCNLAYGFRFGSDQVSITWIERQLAEGDQLDKRHNHIHFRHNRRVSKLLTDHHANTVMTEVIDGRCLAGRHKFGGTNICKRCETPR